MQVKPRFEITKLPNLEWYARLVVGGKVIARSEGYKTKLQAQRWTANLVKWSMQAGTVYLD